MLLRGRSQLLKKKKKSTAKSKATAAKNRKKKITKTRKASTSTAKTLASENSTRSDDIFEPYNSVEARPPSNRREKQVGVDGEHAGAISDSDEENEGYSQDDRKLLEVRLKDADMRRKLEMVIKKRRSEMAAKAKVKVFKLFGLKSIEKMAKYVPTELKHLKHSMFELAPNVQKKYGAAIVRCIVEFVENHDVHLEGNFLR